MRFPKAANGVELHVVDTALMDVPRTRRFIRSGWSSIKHCLQRHRLRRLAEPDPCGAPKRAKSFWPGHRLAEGSIPDVGAAARASSCRMRRRVQPLTGRSDWNCTGSDGRGPKVRSCNWILGLVSCACSRADGRAA